MQAPALSKVSASARQNTGTHYAIRVRPGQSAVRSVPTPTMLAINAMAKINSERRGGAVLYEYACTIGGVEEPHERGSASRSRPQHLMNLNGRPQLGLTLCHWASEDRPVCVSEYARTVRLATNETFGRLYAAVGGAACGTRSSDYAPF